MITPEMYELFDGSELQRRMYYAYLKRATEEMRDLLLFLNSGGEPPMWLDITLSRRVATFSMILTRPKMSNTQGYPRPDVHLVEYLIQWAAGIKNAQLADIMEMERRYPALAMIPFTEILPPRYTDEGKRPGNWLKRAWKSIFK